MSKKLFLGFIEKDPLILLHYFPLVGIVIFAYFQSVWLGLMDVVNADPLKGWASLIGLYYVNLLIGDQLIHKLIGKY